MKKLPVLYPFLFAAFPVLALYSFNITQISPDQLLLPLIVVLAATGLLFVLLGLLLKDKQKGGLLLFLFLFIFFSYGHFYRVLNWPHVALLLVGGLLFVAGAYLIAKSQSNLNNHTLVLNVVTAFLLISSIIKVVPHELERSSAQRAAARAHSMALVDLPTQPSGGEEPGPDIYYLIFDRYANAGVLEGSFGYDNSAFIEHLTKKGFFVASKSYTNYPSTFLSLASSLNMQHLDYLSPVRESHDDTVLYGMLQDYRVWRFLKARGYKFIHFGDWWEPTRRNRFADININYTPLGINGFSNMLLNTTLLAPGIERIFGDTNAINRERVRYKFEKLAEVPEMEGPKFTFAHMLLPHDPYVFGPNGEPLTEAQTGARSVEENYINQLIFTNKQIELLVDTILSKSSRPPIIIIQSDEGPLIAPELRAPAFMASSDWSKISPEALQTHMKILNAYYLPNFAQDLLYDSVTPVNSFRIVFNYYFETDYELLPDKSYISEGYNLPYNFVELPPSPGP